MELITAEDPEARSEDVVDDNIRRLAVLFPEAFSEGKIDFDVLKQLLGDAVDEREEKYGLNWHGKRRARQFALLPSTGTLRPCPDESIEWAQTQHLIIEGDNAEVLKLLQKSYARRVKMIYIDPPYNTGNDFIYKDDYRDNIESYLRVTGQHDGVQKLTTNTEASGRFHTAWLNMMYPRLKLARGLLRDDGVIFITIDDHEVAQLKCIMDELFGEDNCVAVIAWQKVFAKKNKALISGSHDHILVYAKNLLSWSRNLLPRDEAQLAAFSNPDQDARGPWQSVSFSVQSEDAERRKDYRYEITLPSGRKVLPPAGRHWNGLPARYEELLADERLWFGAGGDNAPRQKVFLSEVQEGIVPDTWWRHEDVGNNQEAKKEILELFGDTEPFSTPKPMRLVRRMLQIATTADEEIVLDFFAGSGTTAHAVLDANAADNGKRRYILVQLPELSGSGAFETIFDVTKERVRRASERLAEDHPLWQGDVGFRVFKLDSSNIALWEPDGSDLAGTLEASVQHLKAGRSESDILYELLLKLGLDLCVPVEERSFAEKRVESVGGGVLFACLAEGIAREDVEPLANGIVAWVKELEPAGDVTCVFRDSAFADDVAKTNLTAILGQHGLTNVRSL